MLPTIKKIERLSMSLIESLDPILLTMRAQGGERPNFRRSYARSQEETPSIMLRLKEGSSVDK